MASSVFSIGDAHVYPTKSKKKTFRIRWYAGKQQYTLTVGDFHQAQTIAFEINKDLQAGIYNNRDYYDPKKAVEKARLDERYKSLRFLWEEWKKLDHEYSASALKVHDRITKVLTSAWTDQEFLLLGNAHRFIDLYHSWGYSDGTLERDITDIIACVNYWVKLGKVPHNPYPALRSSLKPKKQDNKGRFTASEKTWLVQLLRLNYSSSYPDLIDFLFMTGLRPEEALALTWGDINLSDGIISINKTYSRGNLRNNTKQGKKGNVVHRKYKMSEDVLLWLKSIWYEEKMYKFNLPNEELIFPSPTGTYINWGNSSKRVWRPAITQLVKEGKIRRYLKPYCTRHTWITEQICKNIPVHIIAAQAGTSIEMITKTYLISNDWWIDEELDLTQYASFIQEYK